MGLIPREVKFFDLLEQLSATIHRGARLLHDFFEAPGGDPEAVRLASQRIHEVENEADEITHEIVERLNKTFITPLDREDIYHLAVRMDDVLDYVDAVAKRLVTFRIATPTAHALELSRIILSATEEIQGAVALLRDLDQDDRIRSQCAKINQAENEGDSVLREALYDLFNGADRDPIEIIKWKDIYEHLEEGTDKAEDVANILETVLVKYS